jgi:alkylated DNA nucleotide flippase Atl1
MPIRIVQISDLHLSRKRGYAVPNFEAAVRWVNRTRPDLVVATGDLILDDPDDTDDLSFARELFDQLDVPWRALPGNHDIGDNPPDPWLGEPVTAARRDRWRKVWGDDWWSVRLGGWVVIGLDSLLFGTGLAAEAAQWSWLSAQVGRAGDRPVMVALHKPLVAVGGDSQTDLPGPVRERLLSALAPAQVRVVASGHVHQYRAGVVGGLASVWAPPVSFVSKPGEPSRYGATKGVGLVTYTLDGDSVTWRFEKPAGMADLDVGAISGGAPTMREAPLRPAGGFEDAVLSVIASLLPGEVVSYAEVAALAGRPRAARGVGGILRVTGADVPWWRVVRSDGSIASPNPEEQARRLGAEGVEVRDGRVVGPGGRRGV